MGVNKKQPGFIAESTIIAITVILVFAGYFFFIGKGSFNLVQPTPTLPVVQTSPTITPELAIVTNTPIPTSVTPTGLSNCDTGLSWYENEFFGICYPENMELKNEEYGVIGDRDTIQTKLGNDSGEVTVWSYFRGGWAGSPCETKVATTLGGYQASRHTFKEETGEGCGEVTGYTTLIEEDPTTSYALSYYSRTDTEIKLETFLTIEQSLQIKKL